MNQTGEMENDDNHGSVIPSGGRILFVDDEENILRSLKRLFMDENYEVFTAPSGAEGLKILEREQNIGLVVSDQRMPKMEGVDFLEQSRKMAPDAVRVLLTGYADINAAVDAINRGGAARYISKPWDDENLKQTVKECLQRYFLIKENKRLQEVIRKKNEELKKWNDELQMYVQEQTVELQNNYNDLKKLNFRMRENFKATIASMSGLLELRDRGMRSHSRNVAKLAGQVAKLMGLSPEECEMVVVGSLLHDIGKIGIPDVMLQLDYDKMDPAGQDEYRKHPVRGQEAIDVIGDLQRQGVLIRHHHERFDGQGFPDRLKGEAIPLGARIIGIADFIDKSIRRFEGDSGVDLVLTKVAEGRGALFDPKLTPLFEKPARALYKEILPSTGRVEQELHPKDLKVGMILGRDVISSTGLLLLSKGTQLNLKNINVLKRYYELDPTKRPIAIWSSR